MNCENDFGVYYNNYVIKVEEQLVEMKKLGFESYKKK